VLLIIAVGKLRNKKGEIKWHDIPTTESLQTQNNEEIFLSPCHPISETTLLCEGCQASPVPGNVQGVVDSVRGTTFIIIRRRIRYI
jgi:hypothetical protein